jgi:hypothetical protein
MPETYHAKLMAGQDEENEELTIEDAPPLQSARLFKSISDAIWARRPFRHELVWSDFSVAAVLEPDIALSSANEVASRIESGLVLAGAARDLVLKGPRGEEVTIRAGQIATPMAATIETFNWDEAFRGRQVLNSDGSHAYARFTDGHVDYARELSANFHFTIEPRSRLVLSYSAQRYQFNQDKLTKLSSHAWLSDFAEHGYGGNSLQSAELTEDQEIDMLKVFAQIGGISVNGPGIN